MEWCVVRNDPFKLIHHPVCTLCCFFRTGRVGNTACLRVNSRVLSKLTVFWSSSLWNLNNRLRSSSVQKHDSWVCTQSLRVPKGPVHRPSVFFLTCSFLQMKLHWSAYHEKLSVGFQLYSPWFLPLETAVRYGLGLRWPQRVWYR